MYWFITNLLYFQHLPRLLQNLTVIYNCHNQTQSRNNRGGTGFYHEKKLIMIKVPKTDPCGAPYSKKAANTTRPSLKIIIIISVVIIYICYALLRGLEP